MSCLLGIELRASSASPRADRAGPRAVLEGVAFALRQIVDTMVGCGADLTRLVASGNGLANPLWRKTLADVLARPLVQGIDEHGSERAGVGAAVFTTVTEPNPEVSAPYQPHYRRFADAYPRLRDWF